MTTDRVREIKLATTLRFSDLWRRNFQANLNAIQNHPGVEKLKDKFRDSASVLVGAGPSLDKNIFHLPLVREKAVIIASDAALKPLLRQGVVPDFVMVLDPQDDIVKFFTGVPHRGITLVVPTIVHPRVLDLWEGSVVFYNKYAPDIPILVEIQKQLPKVGLLIPGGTVLSVAYDFAFKSGSSPIIFIGQDLSYSKKNIYSRSGEDEGKTLNGVYLQQSENVVYETGINGESLPTIKSMSVSKEWFDWAFTTWKRDSLPDILNCSEAGILKDHCRLMPFKEAIMRHCQRKVNVSWILKKVFRRA